MASNRRNWNSDLQNDAYEFVNGLETKNIDDLKGEFLSFIDGVDDDLETLKKELEIRDDEISQLKQEIEELTEKLEELEGDFNE